ncbi:RNA 2',3'-cyclic phosphodiesterase [Legionella nagasakiensis]|uniref:RNA 2',3'-cyclic phosphodiesterase n=1 Tax=Legionella nagasakiensis TaxID=535290 RepID=UPI0013EF7AE2|nr:RNA 2',3'-cyclic phosphodiesterase [Legionella nagasakiensis]
MSNAIYQLAEQLGTILLKRKIRCAVAESCTGGSLAAAITDVPGSSLWFDRAFVTYNNKAKEQMLAVSPQTIRSQGAVSEATARAMAHGVIAHSEAQVSVAITGVAGPDGGSSEKPVGLVWIAWAGDFQPIHSQCYIFKGNRITVRQQAVQVALQGLIQRCAPEKHPQLPLIGKERYFFALYPDEKTAAALYKRGQEIIAEATCSAVAIKNLHITLAYLGSLHPDFLQAVKRMAAQIKSPAFKLKINEAGCWLKAKVCWLGMEKKPIELAQLLNHLTHGLITVGFKPDRSSYLPHVTIARKWLQPVETRSIPSLSWFINDFYLLKSTITSGPGQYEIIERWPLNCTTKAWQ